MEATCAQAVRIGLPSVAFTEHVDHTEWEVAEEEPFPAWQTRHGVVDGRVVIPPFDAEGYLAEIERCRALYPELRILTGVELGEPHWHIEAVESLLVTGAFTRVLASLHSVMVDGNNVDTSLHYRHASPSQVLTDYLTEIERLVTGYDGFQVLAHIDYVLRSWPVAVPLELELFEEHFRHVLGVVKEAGKVLEFNTRIPLAQVILQWWHESGGEAISFASDAHRPEVLANRFREAAHLAEATGFRPTGDPSGFWHRA